MGDLFADRLEQSLKNLRKVRRARPRIDVPDERRFIGFDAYQKVIEAGVDLVLLSTPPHFRPLHYAAAVRAGKHVFLEKPCCVDAPGYRMLVAANKEARAEAAVGGRRLAAPPPAQLPGGDPEDSRRCRGSSDLRPDVLQHARRPREAASAAGDERNGIPDPPLEPVLLALRRSSGGAGVPRDRRGQLGPGRTSAVGANGMGGRQVRVRSRHGRHLRPSHGRVRVSPTARGTSARPGSRPAPGATFPTTCRARKAR